MNKKFSALQLATTLDQFDIIPIVDVSDSTMSAQGTNKKFTLSSLTGFLSSYFTSTGTISGDPTPLPPLSSFVITSNLNNRFILVVTEDGEGNAELGIQQI